jgi:iron complex outermembrane receptor protein
MDFSTFYTPPCIKAGTNKTKTAFSYFYRINPDTKKRLIMRIQLITILLFAACLQISAAGFSQSITLSEKNANLESVLNKIEQQSGYDIFLQTELLAKSNKVSIDVKNLPLDKALDKLFKQQPFTYAIVGHTIVLKEKSDLKTATGAITANIVIGKVVDGDTKEPLTGASITIKGTTKSASAGLDGSFKIDINGVDNPILVISYVGYVSKEIPVSGVSNVGEISLKYSANSMNEVVINGDVAIDRKTPVAVSTIGTQYIEEHIGTQDIPELLNIVPGVYATQQGGGYGDSRISVRGFSSSSGNGNVAYTINGIPVNDPETGAIYWSDFSGITDVATSIQVQRGLGASKVIVPSFGATVNVTTRSTDTQPGGYVSQTIGSDGYDKTAVLISTGLNSNGWAATFGGSRTMGDGFADGLNFLGYNYFFNLSKVLTTNQTLSFNLIGGSQTHGQRPEETIADYEQAPQGIKWNAELGIENGKQVNPYNNFFSEPLFSLNHEWTINDKSSLSTELYAIFGNGGGGEISGTIPRLSNFYSPLDYDAAAQANVANPDGSALSYLYASHDNTSWYGLRSTYKTLLGKYTTLQAGIDLRYYYGIHYEDVTDLLGANYVQDNYGGNPAAGSASGNINDPVHLAVVGDKISYYNEDYVESESAFAQAEYSKKDFTAFVTLTGAENGQKRADYFDYLNSDPEQTTAYVDHTSYQAKGGANYNINAQMNLYANIGYLTKPPYYADVFENYTNQINKQAVDEKLFSYELGYGFKSSGFSAKVDLYRTAYKDRTDQSSYFDSATNQLYSANVTGVDELHQGAEIVLQWRPIKEILIYGMLSLGDYYYTNNPGPTTVFNSQEKAIATINQVDLKNEKIGDAPQTTAAMNLDVNVLPQVKIGVTWNYFSNYTANVPFEDYTQPGLHPYMVPDYSLWALHGTWKFKMAGFDAELIGTVNNLLNTKYISDATDDGATGLASNALVYYGLGRLFTTGLKVKF